MAGHESGRKPKKELAIIQDDKFPTMLRLKFIEGGRLPKSLSGMYKGRVSAQRAIDDYVAGYDRPKIYPKAPKNDIPQRIPPKKVESQPIGETDGEAKDTG